MDKATYYQTETVSYEYWPRRKYRVDLKYRHLIGSVVHCTGYLVSWEKSVGDWFHGEDIFIPKWFARIAEMDNKHIPEEDLKCV